MRNAETMQAPRGIPIRSCNLDQIRGELLDGSWFGNAQTHMTPLTAGKPAMNTVLSTEMQLCLR